jgi:hypothetical protein
MASPSNKQKNHLIFRSEGKSAQYVLKMSNKQKRSSEFQPENFWLPSQKFLDPPLAVRVHSASEDIESSEVHSYRTSQDTGEDSTITYPNPNSNHHDKTNHQQHQLNLINPKVTVKENTAQEITQNILTLTYS